MAYFAIQNKLAGHVINIKGDSDGTLLDASGAKTGSGADAANQQWEFISGPAGSNYYFIKNPHTNHVVDVQGNSTKDGAPLDAYHEKSGDDAANQLWQLIPDPAGSGYYFIQNKLTGHVIDISAADGTTLTAFPLKLFDNDNQLWKPRGGDFPPAVPMLEPPANLGGAAQYVLSGGATKVSLKNIKVTIDVIEDIVTTSLSVQINGFAPKPDKTLSWQQYGIQVKSGSNELVLFANSWPPHPADFFHDYLFYLHSPAIWTLPSNDTIPAKHTIVIELTHQDDGTVTGVKGTVYDSAGAVVGTPQKIALLEHHLKKGGAIGQADLGPVVAFQVVVVGSAGGVHADLASGMGTITWESSDQLTPAVHWPSYSDGANGTAESSNCSYSLVPEKPSLSIVQAFGVPHLRVNPMIIDISGSSEFDISGSGFLPKDQLTLSYVLLGGGSGISEDHSVTCKAEIDGTFIYRLEPPNFPGPEFAPGTVTSFSVTATNQYGAYAEASCQVDAEGRIANFKKGGSGLGKLP